MGMVYGCDDAHIKMAMKKETTCRAFTVAWRQKSLIDYFIFRQFDETLTTLLTTLDVTTPCDKFWLVPIEGT
jgi:hypothetical protein